MSTQRQVGSRLNDMGSLILEEQTGLSLDELCRVCQVQAQVIFELVEEGVITPEGPAPHSWSFTGVHLRRTRVAVRLQRDLGVNLAGAALALELMDELEVLREKLKSQRNRL